MSPKKKYRFLSPEQLRQGVVEIAAAAHVQGERVALIGGYALQFYGSRRLTGDLDIVSEHPLEELREKKPLTFGGYQAVTKSKVPVDVVIRNDDYAPLYESALGFAVRARGLPIPIVRLEYILAMKYALDRPNDVADVKFIVAHSNVDIGNAASIIHKYLGFHTAHSFRHDVKVIKWEKSQGMIPE